MRDFTDYALGKAIAYFGAAALLIVMGVVFIFDGQTDGLIGFFMVLFGIAYAVNAVSWWRTFRYAWDVDRQLDRRLDVMSTGRRNRKDEPERWREHPPLIEED